MVIHVSFYCNRGTKKGFKFFYLNPFFYFTEPDWIITSRSQKKSGRACLHPLKNIVRSLVCLQACQTNLVKNILYTSLPIQLTGLFSKIHLRFIIVRKWISLQNPSGWWWPCLFYNMPATLAMRTWCSNGQRIFTTNILVVNSIFSLRFLVWQQVPIF